MATSGQRLAPQGPQFLVGEAQAHRQHAGEALEDVGGIRAATLQVVATATLAAYISDYGLGRYLFSGLKSRDYAVMLGGSLVVVVLALVLELALAGVQWWVTRRIADHGRTATAA